MERLANATPPACKKCGRDMAKIGKLPPIGVRPLLHVYKCADCREVITIRPE
jgi:DNA-directed RNA polymerase subunit RPC12/RpoP